MSRNTAVKQRQRATGTAKKAPRRCSGSAKSRPKGVRTGGRAKTSPTLPPEQPVDVEQGVTLAAPARPAKPAAAKVQPSARCCIVAATFERATTGAVRMRLRCRGSIAVVVLVPSPAWVEPVRTLFQLRFGAGWEVLSSDSSNSAPRIKEARAVEVATHLSQGRRVIGVAPHLDALPATLATAADLTIRLAAPDASTIGRAIRMFTGATPADSLDEALASGLDFNDLVSAFRKNSSAADIVDRLSKAGAALRGGTGSAERLPALETAVEYGPARLWGMDLARDIKDFKAGRIGWEAVDRGAVLHSAPGLGKSLFARILAQACGVPLVAFSIADLFAAGPGYLDTVVKASRAMFERAASMASPCSILFLDEIDALPNRATMSPRGADWWTPIITDFLLCLDNAVAGQRAGIVVIGATNNIAGVDAAILRPGRLERAIEVTRPDHAGILNILRYHLHASLAGADLTDVGHLLAGSTPAEIMMAVRDARRIARYANRDLALDDLIQSVAPIEDIEPAALLRISTHEAGHAIGALAVPSGVLERCIVGSVANSAGRTIIAMETGDLLTKDAVERRAVALLCARAAEAHLIGSIGLGSGGDETSDLALVTQLLATLHASTGLCGNLAYLVSYEDALQAVRADKALRARVEAHMRKLQARADRIVRRHRDAIIAVADRLRVRRHLSGDEIRRLFEATAPATQGRPARKQPSKEKPC